jgi:hypothetical protein
MKKNRIKPTENQKLLLFAEVNGVCPTCPNHLIYEKNKKKYKRFEIAHIYPLNPTQPELKLLKNENILDSDPNSLNNLICLCVDCHTKFDKPRTLTEYRNLVAIKRKLIIQNREKEVWNNTKLEKEIYDIIDLLSEKDFEFDAKDILNYNPKTIDNKTNNSITYLTKRNIHRNVQDYYSKINKRFSELDKIAPLTTETISSQIRTHYLTLAKLEREINQKDVFDGMVNWLTKQTHQQSNEASEIIISYFIQNCEVFE